MPSWKWLRIRCYEASASINLIASSILTLSPLLWGFTLSALVALSTGVISLYFILRRHIRLSSISGVLGLILAGVLKAPQLLGLILLLFIISYLLSGIHWLACYDGLKLLALILSTTLYVYSLSIIIHKYSVSAKYLSSEAIEAINGHGGFYTILLASIFYFSLVIYWSYSPLQGIPNVSSIAEWLRENRSIPVEILVYSIAIMSAHYSPPVALLLMISLGVGVWAWSYTRRREIGLLAFIVIYAILLKITGYYEPVRDYLLSLLQ